MGTTIEFIEGKIDENINALAQYAVKENLEPWEETIIAGINSEQAKYVEVLSSLKVLDEIKKGNLKVA